jgi:nitronate monooxygenase
VNRYLEEGDFMSDAALPFPYAAMLTLPLRIASEKAGSTEYMQMWAGQAARLGKTLGAEQLTRTLATTALDYWEANR